jgi:2-furoate---CoA ligase
MSLARVFTKAVERSPARTALAEPAYDRRFTYEELDDHVRTLAARMADAGVSAGDRVGIVSQNRTELVSIYWACQYLGAVFVPFNVRASAAELRFLVTTTEPTVLFFSEVSREAVDGARDSFETDRLVNLDAAPPPFASSFATDADPATGSEFEPVTVDEDDVSLILHSSGTTGQPKAIPRTHRNTYAACLANNTYNRLGDRPVVLGAMPMYHTMGIRTIAAPVLFNGTLVLQRSFEAERTLSLVEREGITSLNLVPTAFHDLIESDAIDETDVSSVQSLKYAGMPMTERVERRVRECFEPAVFLNYYGSSEMYTMSVCSWLDEKPGCAGRAGYNTRLRVVDPEERDPGARLAAGEIGEIILDASSPEAFDGYLNRPDANEEAFQDGWYFTGDSGYLDEDGDLFVVGRIDNMIISGGENIYPTEVENVLDEHGEVAEVAVTGADSERWNDVVVAFCRLREGWTGDFEGLAAELDDVCRSSTDLADYKRPRKYVFTADLPKSRVGKVLHRELEEDADDITVHTSVEVTPGPE